MAQTELFEPANGGRLDVKNILVLLTDGTQTPGKFAEDPADIARQVKIPLLLLI